MRARYQFGAWTPDHADHQTYGLIQCKGVYASANGYRPVKGFSEVADALSGEFQGGAAFVGSDGTARMIATDGTNLYSLVSGEWTTVYEPAP